MSRLERRPSLEGTSCEKMVLHVSEMHRESGVHYHGVLQNVTDVSIDINIVDTCTLYCIRTVYAYSDK